MARKLTSLTATRTAEVRREESAWDITVIRNGNTLSINVTLGEVNRKLEEEGLNRELLVTELDIALFNQVPPPDPPDPLFIDPVLTAQEVLQAKVDLIDDITYVRDTIAGGGEVGA